MFYAHPTQETIDQILKHIKERTPFFPVSIRELSLPNVTLPASGILIATSGSTGIPKQAHLSFENFEYSANFPHPDLTLSSSDHYLLSVPLYHVSGLSILYRSYLSGAKIVLPNSGKDHLVTHISFVPTQLKRFLKNPSIYPKLKAILLGGAPIPYDLCMQTYNLGIPLYISYGMTEMASQIATAPFHPKTDVTFGGPLPHRELKIENSEIFVRGKTLFHGYHNLPSTFIDGWLPTKDLGRLSVHGLKIIGRKDRMFISGGENIHPEEIELALLSHPAITHAKVHPTPDPTFDHIPSAFIATPLTKGQILTHLHSHLPHFKIPKEQNLHLNPLNYHWTK